MYVTIVKVNQLLIPPIKIPWYSIVGSAIYVKINSVLQQKASVVNVKLMDSMFAEIAMKEKMVEGYIGIKRWLNLEL